MAAALKAQLIKIGNSHGIRIPKVVLEQLGFDREVELTIEADRLIIRRGTHPRQGWASQFQAMALAGDDQVLDSSVAALSTWDAEEWIW